MQTPEFDPHGPTGRRSALPGGEPVEAHISRTADGLEITLSNGNRIELTSEPLASFEHLLMSAVRWIRRHGAASIRIELE